MANPILLNISHSLQCCNNKSFGDLFIDFLTLLSLDVNILPLSFLLSRILKTSSIIIFMVKTISNIFWIFEIPKEKFSKLCFISKASKICQSRRIHDNVINLRCNWTYIVLCKAENCIVRTTKTNATLTQAQSENYDQVFWKKMEICWVLQTRWKNFRKSNEIPVISLAKISTCKIWYSNL